MSVHTYQVLLVSICCAGACHGRRVQTSWAPSQPLPEARNSATAFSPSSPGARPAESRRLARFGQDVQLTTATKEPRLDQLTIKVLKDKCKSGGLKLSGKKADLVLRLKRQASEGAQSEANDDSNDEEEAATTSAPAQPEPEAKAAESESAVEVDLSSLRMDELKAQLKARGLKVSGKKADLVARLREHAEDDKPTTALSEEPPKRELPLPATVSSEESPTRELTLPATVSSEEQLGFEQLPQEELPPEELPQRRPTAPPRRTFPEPAPRPTVPDHMHLFRSKVSAFQSLKSWAEAFSAGMDEIAVRSGVVQLGKHWNEEQEVRDSRISSGLQGGLGPSNLKMDVVTSDGFVSEINGNAASQTDLGFLAFLSRALQGTKIEDVLAIDLEAFSRLMAEHGFVTPDEAESFKSMMNLVQQQLFQKGHRKSSSTAAADEELPEALAATADRSKRRWSGVGGKGEVAVLLSGGVDSCVALQLALESGLKPRAFYLKIWLDDDKLHPTGHPWYEDFRYAYAMAAKVGVPLEVVSVQDLYWDLIAKEALEQVEAGLTPNTDFMCNFKVKFGLFYDAIGKHFDKIVTGHHAQVRPVEGEEGEVGLFLAEDVDDDQTFQLGNLTQEQLRKVFFPLGELERGSVQELAIQKTLPAMPRRDAKSTFLGKARFADFTESSLPEKPGPLTLMPFADWVGQHHGFHVHGLGTKRGLEQLFNFRGELGAQRRECFAGRGPWKVVHKDAANNEIFIVPQNFFDDHMVDYRTKFSVDSVNWISGRPPGGLSTPGGFLELDVQLRQSRIDVESGPEGKRRVESVHRASNVERSENEEGVYHIKLRTMDRMVIPGPGQIAAFYQGDRCLGAGVIRPRSEGELHEIFRREKSPLSWGRRDKHEARRARLAARKANRGEHPFSFKSS